MRGCGDPPAARALGDPARCARADVDREDVRHLQWKGGELAGHAVRGGSVAVEEDQLGRLRVDELDHRGARDVDEIGLAVAGDVIPDGAIALHLDVDLLGTELARVEDDVLVLGHARTVWRCAGRERGEEERSHADEARAGAEEWMEWHRPLATGAPAGAAPMTAPRRG